MADREPTRLIEPVTQPTFYQPPSARELRSQSTQRLQVGLFGLCAMLLLVGLANIIMERAKLSEVDDPAIEEVIAADEEPKKPVSDPLADIGVVPAADPEPAPEPEAPEGQSGGQANPALAE